MVTFYFIYKHEDQLSEKNLFKCRNSIKKLIMEKVCNKMADCPYGDDEFLCETET